MRCYRRILVVKWQDRSTNEHTEQLYNENKQWWIQSKWGSSNVWAYLQDARWSTVKEIIVWNGRGWASSGTTCTKIDWWHFEVVWQRSERCGINNRRENQIETIRDRLYGPCWPWDQKKKTKKKLPNEWRHQFTRNTCCQYCVKKHFIFVILFSLSVRMMDAVIDPGAAVTKSPPPVIFCQVGVSHIYVTESQPPVIFMPT